MRVVAFGLVSISEDRRELAVKLRRLRMSAGISTREMAALTGWSQSKVTKIENAHVKAKPADVMSFLSQLAVIDLVQVSLVHQAEEIHRRSRSREALQPGRSRSQIGLVSECEQDARDVRMVGYNQVPLHLQTLEYIQASWAVGAREVSLRDFTANKLHRQGLAFMSGRRYLSVVDIGVLTRRSLAVEPWLRQLEHLKVAVRAGGHDFGVLPPGLLSPVVLGSWFSYDKDLIGFESWGGQSSLSTDRSSIQKHQQDLNALSRQALWGSDALSLVGDVIRETRLERVRL